MDNIIQLPLPVEAPDPLESDLVEIDAAIALVASGVATRVCIVGLKDPVSAATVGVAHAQQADVAFIVDRGANGSFAITVGPRANRV